MKSREMRMIFKNLPGFNGSYKINYLGELYSLRIKKLKQLDPSTDKYKLSKNGRVIFISKKEVRKKFFELIDEPAQIINIYNKILVEKMVKEDDSLSDNLNIDVYMYNRNKFDKSLLIGQLISSNKDNIYIELHESIFEQELIKNISKYKALITYKNNVLIELVKEEDLDYVSNKILAKNIDFDGSFKKKHRWTYFKSNEQILDVYRKCYSGKYKDIEIAEEYNVNLRVIINIKYGLTFNDVTHHKEKLINKYYFEKGSSRYNAVIDEKIALEIYKLCYDKEINIPLKDIAKAFNVNKAMVSRIKLGQTWSHVTHHKEKLNL